MYLLQVYVTSLCFGCKEAIRLAKEVSRRHSNLAVEIVDLDGPDPVKSDEVFATPAFVLNGRLLTFGNPTLEELAVWIFGVSGREALGNG